MSDNDEVVGQYKDRQGPRREDGSYTEDGRGSRYTDEKDVQSEHLNRRIEYEEAAAKRQEHSDFRSRFKANALAGRTINKQQSFVNMQRNKQQSFSNNSSNASNHRYNVAVDNASMIRQQVKHRLNKANNALQSGNFGVVKDFNNVNDGLNRKFGVMKNQGFSFRNTLGNIRFDVPGLSGSKSRSKHRSRKKR